MKLEKTVERWMLLTTVISNHLVIQFQIINFLQYFSSAIPKKMHSSLQSGHYHQGRLNSVYFLFCLQQTLDLTAFLTRSKQKCYDRVYLGLSRPSSLALFPCSHRWTHGPCPLLPVARNSLLLSHAVREVLCYKSVFLREPKFTIHFLILFSSITMQKYLLPFPPFLQNSL